MTHKSIKLLSLAVILGCSLIAFAVAPSAHDIRVVLMLAVAFVTGLWFLVYWLLFDSGQK